MELIPMHKQKSIVDELNRIPTTATQVNIHVIMKEKLNIDASNNIYLFFKSSLNKLIITAIKTFEFY